MEATRVSRLNSQRANMLIEVSKEIIEIRAQVAGGNSHVVAGEILLFPDRGASAVICLFEKKRNTLVLTFHTAFSYPPPKKGCQVTV